MTKKLNVGLFIDTFYPMIDGVVMVVDNYAKKLSKYANVTVFCPNGKTKFDDSTFEYRVVRCKSMKFPNYCYTVGTPSSDGKFKKALKESNLDIVHIHSPFGLGKIGAKYAKKHGVPLVGTIHSQYKMDFLKATHIKWLSLILLKNIMKTYNSCDECWTVNNYTEKVCLEEYNLKTKHRIQRNAGRFEPIDNVEEARAEVNNLYNLKDDDKVFLFVGRLIVLKNILLIADALKVVKDAGVKFKMLFVGFGPDENKLKAKIKEHGLEDCVTLCGKVSDQDLLKKIYARADLFLFPSMYDASSLVQIEAASQHTPSLFVRGSVTSGTVTEDVNGFMAEENPQKFAEKIVEIVNNKEYYDKVTEGAFRDIYVSWDSVVEEVMGEYRRIIEEKKTSSQLQQPKDQPQDL